VPSPKPCFLKVVNGNDVGFWTGTFNPDGTLVITKSIDEAHLCLSGRRTKRLMQAYRYFVKNPKIKLRIWRSINMGLAKTQAQGIFYAETTQSLYREMRLQGKIIAP
jgi:hypothetical protein